MTLVPVSGMQLVVNHLHLVLINLLCAFVTQTMEVHDCTLVSDIALTIIIIDVCLFAQCSLGWKMLKSRLSNAKKCSL